LQHPARMRQSRQPSGVRALRGARCRDRFIYRPLPDRSQFEYRGGIFVPSTSERRELATVPVGFHGRSPVHTACTVDRTKGSIHKNKQLPTLTPLVQHHSAADVLRMLMCRVPRVIWDIDPSCARACPMRHAAALLSIRLDATQHDCRASGAPRHGSMADGLRMDQVRRASSSTHTTYAPRFAQHTLPAQLTQGRRPTAATASPAPVWTRQATGLRAAQARQISGR